MAYLVVSADDRERERWERRLDECGYDALEEYEPGATVLTLGGDGTILYAARTYGEPTILPVRTAGSAGNRTTLGDEDLLEALSRLESGRPGEDYAVARHRKLAAFRDGTELRGDFDALNEVGLHHRSPVRAAVFALRVRGGETEREFERVVGDGVVVATPFGSTGYYRSITGGTFDRGVGVAFNNVHAPPETPEYLVLDDEAVVEVELLEAEHGSGGVLARDDDRETIDVAVGSPIEIRLTERVVEIVRPG